MRLVKYKKILFLSCLTLSKKNCLNIINLGARFCSYQYFIVTSVPKKRIPNAVVYYIVNIEQLLFLKFLNNLAFLTAIFGYLTKNEQMNATFF